MGNLARLGFTDLPDWHAQGACNGRSDLDWYTDTPDEIAAIKAVCGGCPVQAVCLRHALDDRESWGLWGGYTPEERDVLALNARTFVGTIVRHGERARYVGTKNVPGCRCELCTRAHADYEHQRRTAIAERGPNWVAPTKPCRSCGKEFTPRQSKQLHCTQACRLETVRENHRRAMAARRCIHCGGPMGDSKGLNCSTDCAGCQDPCGDPRRANEVLRPAAGRCCLCKRQRPPGRHRYCDDDCRELAAIYSAERRVVALQNAA